MTTEQKLRWNKPA